MKWIITLAALGCIASLAACHRTPLLTQQEQKIVTELSANLTPRCVGRYVIDMPSDALVFGGATLDGIKVEAKAMTQEDYEAAMEARSQELGSIKTHTGPQFLYADDTVNGIKGSRYFISQGKINVLSPATRIIEAYKWDRSYQIKLQIEGSDFTNPDQTNDPIVKQLTEKNDVPGKLRLVISILDRIRGRRDDEIPTEPGVCFIGGFLPGRATDQENIWFQFVLREQHDVSFGLDTDANIKETTTLLQRGDSVNAALKDNDGRTVRKGRVDLPGMQAEEWLMAGITTLHVPGHHLTLEANSLIGSAKTPLITLDMDTGSENNVLRGPIEKASLTEGEAVALWDAVSRTLRPRSNGF
jgi:hypothetical protein